MNILSIMFGFNGRINRAQWWLGNLGAAFAAIVLVTLLVILGSTNDANGKSDPLQMLGALGLALIPAAILMIWCGLALQVKRFHDRGRTGWLVVVPMEFSFISAISAVGAMIGGADPLTAASAGQPWGALSWLVQIAYLIDLGFLPSKEGPNKYGNPPNNSGGSVAPVQPAAPVVDAVKTNASAAAASSLVGAQSAIDRAIAEKAQPRPAAPVQAAPRPALTGAPAAPASFGRRPAR